MIKDPHTDCGHKGEKITDNKIAEHYGNISMTVMKSFVSQYEGVLKKTKRAITPALLSGLLL